MDHYSEFDAGGVKLAAVQVELFEHAADVVVDGPARAVERGRDF
jgi:hypothetical protein